MTPEPFTLSGFHAAAPASGFWVVATRLSHMVGRALGLQARSGTSPAARRDHPDQTAVRIDAEARDALLRDARTALRLGYYDEAETLLVRSPNGSPLEADRLNLMGVACEAQRRWADARRWYRRAVRADSACRAARQNLRRLYELETFGRTAEHLALGDERPALAALLRMRAAPAPGGRIKEGRPS